MVTQAIFAQRVGYYQEKQLFLKITFGTILMVAIAQFTLQFSISRTYVTIFDGMKAQCRHDPIELTDGTISESQYTHSQWHDYDFAY